MSYLGKKPPSQRQLRVGELLRQAMAEIFMRGELYSPVIDGMSVTVSEVRVSPDMKNATVFVSALGDSSQNDALTKELTALTDVVRRMVSKRVHLRYTPRLYFKEDDSYDTALKVHTILNKPEVARDLKTDSTQEPE